VAPQGYLAYMTCTYSPQENEEICEWFLERFPQFQAVEISHLQSYQSHLTSVPCYRMFPQDKLGAGAFTVLFKNTQEGERKEIDVEVLSAVWMNTNREDIKE
jgi:16S rRNA C967 or C1407 C5-methylase (RsmB/RsmF family)